jgi:uncharacterized membrane protein
MQKLPFSQPRLLQHGAFRMAAPDPLLVDALRATVSDMLADGQDPAEIAAALQSQLQALAAQPGIEHDHAGILTLAQAIVAEEQEKLAKLGR